jgi:deoxyribonuclease V
VAPVFVSQGNRISLTAAVQTVLDTFAGYRLPEPTRRAHLLVNETRLLAKEGTRPVLEREG